MYGERMTEYLKFVVTDVSQGRGIFEVHDRYGSCLGDISWYSHWRTYVFAPAQGFDIIFSAGCLDEISSFLKQQGKVKP